MPRGEGKVKGEGDAARGWKGGQEGGARRGREGSVAMAGNTENKSLKTESLVLLNIYINSVPTCM